MNKSKLNVAIIGLGTVGSGVIKLLKRQKSNIKNRTGIELDLVAISAKNKRKKRSVDISPYRWIASPINIAKDPDVDVIVELIGDMDNTARKVIKEAINNGKHVVTANKSLLAKEGSIFEELARKKNVFLRYEAAVAGGIPIIKVLQDSLIVNKISKLYGVINGTCNFILTKMEAEGREYTDVFSEAKQLGYVESDPRLDIGGIDSAHKLALLSCLAFGTSLDFEGVKTEGIDHISIEDIEEAHLIGYKIKLLATAEYQKKLLRQEVSPKLIRKESPIAQVNGSTNIIAIEGEEIGTTIFSGPGAGMGPTASSVVSDLVAIASRKSKSTFLNGDKNNSSNRDKTLTKKSSFYLRFVLKDKPGVIARLSGKLGSYGISINQMKQKPLPKQKATLIMTTHKTVRKSLEKALNDIKRLKICEQRPVSIEIEEI
ncbi:MAG: homoserine dehydrogenase [Rhodobacteraceae bacterium]|nr:homoserine dehydrogenase [Paracoccaceae bacterium]